MSKTSTAQILSRLETKAFGNLPRKVVAMQSVKLKLTAAPVILIRPAENATIRNNPEGVPHRYWQVAVPGGKIHFHAYDDEAYELVGKHLVAKAELKSRTYETGQEEHFFDLFPTTERAGYSLRIYQTREVVPKHLLGHQLLVRCPQGGYLFFEPRSARA